MKYLEIIDEVERELSSRVYAWQDFFPGLNPDDWQIVETADGIYGKKIKGKLAGTVAFFLALERIAEGPPERREPSSWEFRKVTIGKDTWMVGVADTRAETAWYVREPKKQ